MKTTRVCIELEDRKYEAYRTEAERRGVSVESLIEATVQIALRELQQRDEDVPVILE